MVRVLTNLDIAELLRKVSAAYQITGANRFRIIAYDRAADSIEHLTSEAKDLWDDGKLADVPGIGAGIAGSLDELFRTGHVKHFDEVMSRVPASVYPLLLVPGIGPKRAYKLVTELHLEDEQKVIEDLQKACEDGRVAELEGFGEKSQQDIIANIELYRQGQIRENRMTLPEADSIARQATDHLRKHKAVGRIDTLGSLRRQASTIGDVDISVATTEPEAVVEHFLTFPHKKLIEKGPTGTSVLLNNGRQIDLRVQDPATYGSMLQYFTGSKNHNIHLRTYALDHGMSLSEYGIKNVKSGKVKKFDTEEGFYKELGMPWIPPELREDMGEIEAAVKRTLPDVVSVEDIRGDLHIHTSYDLEPSHDLGANTLAEVLGKAGELGYEYVGISDHNPSVSKHSEDDIVTIMKKRKAYYEQVYSSYTKKSKKDVRVIIMCEVDILTDGRLALPEAAFEYVDAVIVSVHSAFTQDADTVTKRVVRALTSHPKVRIFGHPTGRLLGKREGINIRWKDVFAVCKKRDIALEINAYPVRLDLPDHVVFDAVREGIKLTIDTDSHAIDHMELMKYGVSVARRGWATPDDILNTLPYNKFAEWLGKTS